MKRRALRVAVGVLGLLLVIIGIALADFYSWRSSVVAGIETDPRRRIASTALGDIEYAVEGDGVPVLVLHGSLGGYDSALQVGSRLENVRIIAVSRPGYLGTPLSAGASHQEQADLFAALLDQLGIDRVVVYAVSAGGPYGMEFSLRHPERTLGLVLGSTGLGLVPDATDLEPDRENPVPELGNATLLFADMYMWASARFFPSMLGNSLSDSFDADDPVQIAQVERLARSLVPMGSRWAGNYNDGIQSADPAGNDWPLEESTVPTLIVHGDRDPLSSYEAAQIVAERIPAAELLTIEGAGHAAFTAEQLTRMSSTIASFIEKVTR
jgi:pimeloyl-ACP methyl ester carboxylesterase